LGWVCLDSLQQKGEFMTFSSFAKRLYPIVGEGCSTGAFTKSLLASITEDAEEILDGYSKNTYKSYFNDTNSIQKFAKYAVEEMELYKIPASIKLAQGILETGGGQSRLAKEGKNHFGIKCKENWTGKTMKHTDDAPNECFRVYDDPRESYRDHSLFLTTRKYYVGLFKLDIKDYKGNAFDLTKYVDKSTGFISSKSKNGRELKALELPGLWNGAMSDWNTVFVEVPLGTFNPVKTVNDLLREQHQ